MSTLIVYATKYGCTGKCAKTLAERISGSVELRRVTAVKPEDLSQYEKVIIGGSIRIGKIQKEISAFCAANLHQLKEKKIGLFICCMRDGDIAAAELNSAFPAELFRHAQAKEYFGGEFILKKMGFLDRMVVKKVAKVEQDVSNILAENIDRFVYSMNSV